MSEVPTAVAEKLSVHLQVCPHCKQPVRPWHSVRGPSLYLIYHANCYGRRVQQ